MLIRRLKFYQLIVVWIIIIIIVNFNCRFSGIGLKKWKRKKERKSRCCIGSKNCRRKGVDSSWSRDFSERSWRAIFQNKWKLVCWTNKLDEGMGDRKGDGKTRIPHCVCFINRVTLNYRVHRAINRRSWIVVSMIPFRGKKEERNASFKIVSYDFRLDLSPRFERNVFFSFSYFWQRLFKKNTN